MFNNTELSNNRYSLTQLYLRSDTDLASMSTLQISNPRRTDEGSYQCILNYNIRGQLQTIVNQTHYLEFQGCNLYVLMFSKFHLIQLYI